MQLNLSEGKHFPRFLQAWIDQYTLEKQKLQQTRAIMSGLTPYEQKFIQVFTELNPSETKTFKWLLSQCDNRREISIEVSSVDLMLYYLSEQVGKAGGPTAYLERPQASVEVPYLLWLNHYLRDLASINGKLRKSNEEVAPVKQASLKQWLIFLAKPLFCAIAASTLFSYGLGYFSGFLHPVNHCQIMDYVNRTLRPEAIRKHAFSVVRRIDANSAHYGCKISSP